jgi:hypothetical protein
MNGQHKLTTPLMSTKLQTIALFALIVLGLFPGCVPSWNPLYTDKDLVFDPQLVGTWKGEDGETWKFEKSGDKKYKLVYVDSEGTATFAAHLLKINGRQFLDLFLHESAGEEIKLNSLAKATLVPAHLFLRVDEIGSSLKMAAVNPTWLEEHLEANPKATPHLKQEDRVIFTGTPLELQAFVLQHAEGEALFGDPFTLKRESTK